MNEGRSHRRSFLTGFGAALISQGSPSSQVPWSTGTERPRTKAPEGTTDCHHHIYDARFPVVNRTAAYPGNATVSDYRRLQERVGVIRHVVVQPSAYGADNRCLIDALQTFGHETARGIAVVDPTVTEAELARLDKAGVCGIRLNLAAGSVFSAAIINALAKRIAPRGWHIQINASVSWIRDSLPLLGELPVSVVFDHLAHVPDANDPLFRSLVKLLQSRRAWVKLSGAYLDTKSGPPAYADRTAVARAYLAAAPERLIWGSDWPHPSVQQKPDDALLFDLLAQWAENEAIRHRVLVDNPATLYRFS